MFKKNWKRDLWSWPLGKLPRLRLVSFDAKFWAEHLEVEFTIDSKSKNFSHKQTLNNTFASAVQVVPEYVSERNLFQKEIR